MISALSIGEITKRLKEKVHSKEEIIEQCILGFQNLFPNCRVTVRLLESEREKPGPSRVETDWLVARTKDLLAKNPTERNFVVISEKNTLSLILTSEDEVDMGYIFVQNWDSPHKLGEAKLFASNISVALDNTLIHERIENLLTDKKELKKRIQKDEEDLKRRILELTVLYETSNALGHSLDYSQVITLVLGSLYRVLHFDVSVIFLTDFHPNGEIITRVNTPLKNQTIKKIQTNILSAVKPFAKRDFDAKSIVIRTEKNYSLTEILRDDPIHSYANVPLVFKEEVIGLLSICSTAKNVFNRNEMTFLHTMSNQLASHLGRLKAVKMLEKSKINSLIKSMAEGVVMLDSRHNIEIINPAAELMLALPDNKSALADKLNDLGLQDLYSKTLKSNKPILNQPVMYQNKILSANIAPVIDVEKNRVGTVIVFRDETEIQKINRINAQRLEILSRVEDILTSIPDLDTLLGILIEFILNVARAEMGAIQLKEGKNLVTRVHSNFPDKIRQEYRFRSGESISEYVRKTKKICFVDNYSQNPKVKSKSKILLDWYLCIPITFKEDLIGLVSIARKYDSKLSPLFPEDISTLTTITALTGASIQNAIFYQETLKKQKLDQELKVAYNIQTTLLPERLPRVKRLSVGAVSIPAREIGGDYYDFFEYDNGNIGIVVADIVGKGIPAGLYMAMLKSILHTHLTLFDSPKKALERINSILYRDPVVNRFIPLFFGILNPETMLFRYTNAGHEPALLFTKGKFHSLDTAGFPVGALEDTPYEEKKIHLHHGDILLMFTDGLIEGKSETGKPFGIKHVKQLIKQHAGEKASHIAETIYTAARSFSPTGQHDDITIVGLKIDDHSLEHISDVPVRVKELRTTSAKKNVKMVRREVETIAKDMGFGHSDIFNLQLAINEAHANVIDHAYHGREDGQIIFRFDIFEDRLEVSIKDFGPGLDQRSIKGEEIHLEELEGSGLGVLLIKSVMDQVKYKRTSKVGTELVLTKYLPKELIHGNH